MHFLCKIRDQAIEKRMIIYYILFISVCSVLTSIQITAGYDYAIHHANDWFIQTGCDNGIDHGLFSRYICFNREEP